MKNTLAFKRKPFVIVRAVYTELNRAYSGFFLIENISLLRGSTLTSLTVSAIGEIMDLHMTLTIEYFTKV